MATKKIETTQQATTTVDGLPQGVALSDSDSLMVMQGDGTRKTVKVFAKAIKDYLPGGKPYELPVASETTLGGVKVGANLSITPDGVLNAQGGGGSGKQFVKVSGKTGEWSPDVSMTDVTLVVNTYVPSFFIRLPRGDFKLGTTIDIIMLTGNSVTSVVSGDDAVQISAPFGNAIKRDQWAKLVYVSKDLWALRGYALELGVPYMTLAGPVPRTDNYSPFRAWSECRGEYRPDLKIILRARETADTSAQPFSHKVNTSETFNVAHMWGEKETLKGWTNYDFWAVYSFPDGTESVTSNVLTYEVQGDTPRAPTFEPVTGRGYLELMKVSASQPKPDIAMVQISYQDGIWVDCTKDKYSDLWSYLAIPRVVKDYDNIQWRVAAANGKWTEPQSYKDFPFKKNIAPRETFVRMVNRADPFAGFELRWRNKDTVNDPDCKWIVSSDYYSEGRFIETVTNEVDWATTDHIYTFFTVIPKVRRRGQVKLVLTVQAKTYGYVCEPSKLEVTYDSGEPSTFEVKSISPDWNAKEFIVEFTGIDPVTTNVYAQLSLTQSMGDPIYLSEMNKKYSDKEWLSGAKVPAGVYFAQAAAFEGGNQTSEWLPLKPIKVEFAPPFTVLEARAFAGSKSVQVRAEPVFLATDAVQCHASYTPDMTSYFNLTGGEYKDGWFTFNAGSMVTSKDLYIRAARWREGDGVDTPFLPSPPILVKWQP